MTYATDRLFEEVAYVAYHFHWSLDTILDLRALRCACGSSRRSAGSTGRWARRVSSDADAMAAAKRGARGAHRGVCA